MSTRGKAAVTDTLPAQYPHVSPGHAEDRTPDLSEPRSSLGLERACSDRDDEEVLEPGEDVSRVAGIMPSSGCSPTGRSTCGSFVAGAATHPM